MPQLLESTRNYLKVSTKLGRRMSSNSRDESSEGSLHNVSPTSVEKQQQPQQQQRTASQTRLASLFNFEGRNRSSVSTDRKSQDLSQQDNSKKRRSSSSQKSTQSLPAAAVSRTSMRSDSSSRGPSSSHPGSNKVRRATTYDVRPNDYPSMDQYKDHVRRRNLLEESIMHSLKLGYAESPRSAKRSATDRSRKPTEDSTVVLGRGMSTNSPYQLVNSSTANITQSMVSFTLELPEDHVAQVLSSSSVPQLFKIKQTGLSDGRPKAQRGDSRTLHTGPSPSPRVLTGKTAARHLEFKENMEPRHMPQVVAAV
ncbi:MAG: hypothetical protein J3Q66DRAFT_399323 [Benniella sp.]|nr:MAG: hypothetical protein J3Q66DRAFT_399323 [Benniella sp.]